MREARVVIVTQKLAGKLRNGAVVRWGAVLTAVVVIAVAAIGFAPHLATGSVKRSTVSESLTLPVNSPPRTANEVFGRETHIRRGDTLASVLARLKVNDAAASAFLNTSPAARAFAQLIPGRAFRAKVSASGKLLALHYHNGDITHSIVVDGDAFVTKDTGASAASAPAAIRRVTAAGVIRSSLFAATDAANIPDSVAVQLVEIFSTDIDFHKDLRKGDRFSVVYEAMTVGESTRPGRVLSAEFSNLGRTLNVVWFNTGDAKDGKGEYYTLEGRNIRKAFLRSPLEFSRITSGFSMRFHPIMQTWRAHNGVDYAAPIGMRIKATADGTVDFAGVQQGYGNVIILRHQGKYTTLYAHMQGFASGVRKGARVNQGDVIGAVGMTGMTTGPHVHYEFRVNDTHVDPLSVAVPHSFPIEPRMRARFEHEKAPQARLLALLREAIPANFE